ncbi:hypothetical protein HpMS107_25810 [Helicobacter pylori]
MRKPGGIAPAPRRRLYESDDSSARSAKLHVSAGTLANARSDSAAYATAPAPRAASATASPAATADAQAHWKL